MGPSLLCPVRSPIKGRDSSPATVYSEEQGQLFQSQLKLGPSRQDPRILAHMVLMTLCGNMGYERQHRTSFSRTVDPDMALSSSSCWIAAAAQATQTSMALVAGCPSDTNMVSGSWSNYGHQPNP